MARISSTFGFAAMAALCVSASAYAQQPPAKDTLGAAPGTVEAKLVFDREVFSYSGSGRRDPFKPLVGKESLGPLFEDLKLKVIIYSSDPSRSIVLVEDGAKRLYRLRRGDIVGNSRVVEITPLAVRFAVENFGNMRYQVLELRPGAAGAAGLSETRAVPPAPPIGGVDFKKVDPATAKRLLDSLAKERRDKAVKQEPEAKQQQQQDDTHEWPFEQGAHR
ncbi:MAG TPA: hypothetical protein VF021_06340 [Longimicrobiales bacterium]